MSSADVFLEHILGLMEISFLDDPDHPICLALESNGIDSASGMSLISPQNLASLSYMDKSSGTFKTLRAVHRQLLLMLSGFAVHFDDIHGHPMTTQDWLATTVDATMAYFLDSPAFKVYRRAHQYSLFAGHVTPARKVGTAVPVTVTAATTLGHSTHHVTPSLGEDMDAPGSHGYHRNHMVTSAHVDTEQASAHVSPSLGEDVVNSTVHYSNQRPHIDMVHYPTVKVASGINCHQLVQTMTLDDCAAYTVKVPGTVTVASGIIRHQPVDYTTVDDCAAYTVKAPGIICHQLVDNTTFDDCAAYTVVKAPGISCHQLVDNITIDDCAAYTARTGDHRDLSLQPPVECDLSTSYYACPVSDTGLLAPLHGEDDEEDKDTSYYAHPVSDTGLAVLHGEEASPPTLAHPVSDTGLAPLCGEEEASPTTLPDPGILDDHGEHNHHHAAEEDPLVALVFDWGPLMELPDDSTDKSPLGNTQEEEEVVLLYSNWSLAENPHGEPPYRLPDEELTPSCVEHTPPPTEVKILTTLADARMLKTTCSEDRMLKTCSEDRMLLALEDKVLSSPPADETTLSATDMMCVPSPEDGVLLLMSLPKDGELTLLGHGELHDHADGELPLVLLLYDTKLGKFHLGELGTLGLPTMDGGRNYPPPKAMQRPLPAPEPPPLVLNVLVQKN
jgi:hypothetical protein